MNFEPTEDQRLIAETFGKYLDEHSSMRRVRAALPQGFDPMLWKGLAGLGAFAIRVKEDAGGMGLGLMHACLVMEEAGRTLASVPLAEAIVAARMLARAGPAAANWLERMLAGEAVVTLALRDAAFLPRQLVAGGAVADAVIALDGDTLWIVEPTDRTTIGNLADMPIAEIALDRSRSEIAAGEDGRRLFAEAVEEWKLLIAAQLEGMSREAIRLASVYAAERIQFGRPIGSYQAVSHPLADLLADVEGGRFLVWRAIRQIADRAEDAGGMTALACWWACRTATKATARALHTFGGYGLTTEYDIHLFNLRAKAWPLIWGDPADLLVEAGDRLWCGAPAESPEAGEPGVEFGYGAEAKALAEETRAFFERNLTPELRAKAHYSFDGHDPGFHRAIAEAGLLFPSWPVEAGGRAASPYAAQAAAEIWDAFEWSQHSKGVSAMVGQVAMAFGSPEVKRHDVPRIGRGEAVCCLGFSEPQAGSDVFAAKLQAVRAGDDWIINGQKMFTSGADVSDYVLLLARTDGNGAKHEGLTMFLLPLDLPGIEIQAIHTFQEEKTNITFYSDVRVPDRYRLGEVDQGLAVMRHALTLEQGSSGGFVRSHDRLIRSTVEWARAEPRGNGRAIDKEGVRARLARARAHQTISDMLLRRSLWLKAENRPDAAYGPMAKLFSSEMFLADSADLLDLAAPRSLSTEKGPGDYAQLAYRLSAATTIYGGTSEVHRSQIAERLLGLPRTRS